MISQEYIKLLEFKTIEDIYLYIVDSKINGNYTQTKELINKLSQGQFKDFCEWFKWCDFYTDETINNFINMRGF